MGIKESLFDYEHLAAYLLYRLNSIPPSPSMQPPYPLPLRKPTKSRTPLKLTESIEVFLDELAGRMGYLQPGGVRDRQRAAKWFVEWWRDAGGTTDDSGLEGGMGVGGSEEWGWGLDCQWADRSGDPLASHLAGDAYHSTSGSLGDLQQQQQQPTLESKFDKLISQHLTSIQNWEAEVSETQMKKREKEEKLQRRVEKGDEAAKKRAATLKRRTKR